MPVEWSAGEKGLGNKWCQLFLKQQRRNNPNLFGSSHGLIWFAFLRVCFLKLELWIFFFTWHLHISPDVIFYLSLILMMKKIRSQAKIVGFECKLSAPYFQDGFRCWSLCVFTELFSQRNDDINSDQIQNTGLEESLSPYCTWTIILGSQTPVLCLGQGEPSVSSEDTEKRVFWGLLKSSRTASSKNLKNVKFILISLPWPFGHLLFPTLVPSSFPVAPSQKCSFLLSAWYSRATFPSSVIVSL